MPLKGGESLARKCKELGHPIEHYLGWPTDYYEARGIWLDTRWPEYLHISPKSDWGFRVMAIVGYHNTHPDRRGEVLQAHLYVEDHAFIFNRAILFNCRIGKYAVVGAGSVVCSMTVEPYTMVAGNPARPVKYWSHELGQWVRF